MGNKYGAIRTYSNLCERWFASKAECRRGEELILLRMGGEISYLQYQIPFTLSHKPKVTITIDFAYKERIHSDPLLEKAGEGSSKIILYGSTIYEDTKGALTRDFRTKLAWLKQLHNIDVKLTK